MYNSHTSLKQTSLEVKYMVATLEENQNTNNLFDKLNGK